MQSNEELVRYLLMKGDADTSIANIMLEVDRKDFLPYEQKESAYQDIPLPIGYEQTASAPSIIAFMLKSLDIREGMKVLEIGSGSGYQTALLSKLVGKKGKVMGLEVISELAEFAKLNIKRYNLSNVLIINASGEKGYKKEAPYDRVVYSAATDEVENEVINQLREKEGRIVVPVKEGEYQVLYLITKKKNIIRKVMLTYVQFVDLKTGD